MKTSLYRTVKRLLVAGAALAGMLASGCATVSTMEKQASGSGAEAKNMRLVGASDLQARSAYQPVIQQQGGRFIAYIGHHGGSASNPLNGQMEPNGTSIVDVTD